MAPNGNGFVRVGSSDSMDDDAIESFLNEHFHTEMARTDLDSDQRAVLEQNFQRIQACLENDETSTIDCVGHLIRPDASIQSKMALRNEHKETEDDNTSAHGKKRSDILEEELY